MFCSQSSHLTLSEVKKKKKKIIDGIHDTARLIVHGNHYLQGLEYKHENIFPLNSFSSKRDMQITEGMHDTPICYDHGNVSSK